jgi:hypothetical protein
MGITRAVIGAVAAAGVARLLAPKQTERAIEAVKEGVSAGLHSAEDTMGMTPKRSRSAAARVKAGASRTMKAGASRAKRAVKSATSKTKTAAKKAAPKVRKAARRPRSAGK